MMKNKKLGLYIHIPFCLRKCNYCDFCSFADIDKKTRLRYIDRICDEIYSYRDKADDYHLESIFFGGGTPSLLEPFEFVKIVDAIKDIFSFDNETEFTLESNPKTLTKEKLQTYVRCGVNRLSIGLQSVHENELKILGRIHDFDDFLHSFALVQETGIRNINVDLMYSIPEQTVDSFKSTVDIVSDLPLTHISAYSLIIEEDTPFGRMKNALVLPSEEDELMMVDYLHEKLREKGFIHYEISNYAKDGFSSKHNLLYWNMDEYIGLGINAHSDFQGVRYANTSVFNEYLSEDFIQYRVSETPDNAQRAFEYAMLRLRLREGLSLSEYEERFHCAFLEGKEEYINKCIEGGFMLLCGDRLSFTEEGFYVSNEILSSIL